MIFTSSPLHTRTVGPRYSPLMPHTCALLPPVDVKAFEGQSVRKLATHCRELMSDKLDALNGEVAAREAAGTR